ncbi:TetR family transcriptional regulator [Agromyces sp. H3Y2-19a]|uniref:TetR/AcrR family transcriptional regulator n=1 Tax=Agromyces TaxID=33877 RepID=UPI0023B93D6B|nr:TetR family transcriptional regulator [Agromyces chromiiresistens]MDF0513462.1 TetR family transcriptional regulator [Agromyces chromiiresistens]
MQQDLTTRARIRDAAVLLFGRDGFERTSLRAIAKAAGVSPGLVIHHFGSKDALRTACDEFVVSEFIGRKDELRTGDPSAAMQRWLDDTEKHRPLIDYVSRMLTEPTSAADELFDALLAGTTSLVDEQVAAGIMRVPADREVTALYLTMYGVVPLVMQRQLARSLGTDVVDAAALRRSTIPILELYTNGLYADDRFLVAARDALGRSAGPRSDKGENDPNQDPDPPRG